MASTTANSVSQTPTTPQTDDLWEKAVEALEDDDKLNVDFKRADKLDILKDILVAVDQKKRICLEKRWKYKKGNKQIIIRDQLEKVAEWVNKFKQIGDSATQYDPVHAALPWAGVRFLLQVTVNDVQTFGAIAEGLELISNLITRCAIMEELYLRTLTGTMAKNIAESQLKQAILKLYVAILKYLSNARRYYDRNTAVRLVRAVVQTAESTTELYTRKISIAKADVDECARLWEAHCRHKINDNVEKLNPMMSDKVEGLRTILLQLDEPINRSAALLSDIHDCLKANERREMFKWLSRIPYEEHHKTMGKNFLPDSGQWLLQKKEYINWRRDSCSSVLWLHGIPGSGKSMMIFLIVEELRKQKATNEASAPFAYFYCARNTAEPERANPDEIMRSILKQLSSSKTNLPVREPVATSYKTLKEKADDNGLEEPARLTVTECETLILGLLESNPATIVIDALDECDPDRRFELLLALDRIIQKSANVFKVFVSSRDDNDIVCRLEDSPNVIIRASDNGKDIKRFVGSLVLQSINNKRLLSGRVSEELRNHIIRTLEEGAQGMFRWASLQIQNLCDSQRLKHESDIIAELGQLPKTLRGSYDVIYQRIKSAGSTSQKVADRAIRWVLCAQCSLNVTEFIAAISVDFNGNFVSLSVSQVLDICCNMLVLDEELETFRFAHLSVREYFEGLKSFDKSDRHAFVLERCIDTITSELQNPSEPTLVGDESLKPYARGFWLEHFIEAGNILPTPRVNEKMMKFLVEGSDTSPLFISWLSTYIGPGRRVWTIHAIKSFPNNPLFVLIYCGSSSIIRQLGMLKNHYWVQKNHGGMSCIGFAASLGYWEIVRLFLERENIDINDKDEKGCTPLMWATKAGNMPMLQTLLKHEKIDVNVQDRKGYTPITWAITRSTHIDTDLDDKRDDGQSTSLKEKNYEAIVQLLLEHKNLDVNIKDKNNQTSLHFAAAYGHVAIMSLLLKHQEIEVNVENGYGGTPLLVAAASGQEVTVRRLLAHENVDVNARNMGSETSLFVAAHSGYEEVVRLLLDHNEIDANAKDERDQTPLYVAARSGYEKVVRLLLNRNEIDVNARNMWSETSLFVAARWDCNNIIQLLLEHKEIDANAKDEYGRTPLYVAVSLSHEEVTRLLLNHNEIDANAKDDLDRTSLHVAACLDHEEVVRLLLKHKDVDVNAKCKAGNTPLSIASCQGHDALVRLLLENKNVDINAKNDKGETPLSIAMLNGHDTVVQMILQHGP